MVNQIKQFTEKQAIEFSESGQWKDLTEEELVRLQLFQDKLCIPFGIFHRACNTVFGRSVFTSEFANKEKLQAEYLGQRPAPTLEEILEPLRRKGVIFTVD